MRIKQISKDGIDRRGFLECMAWAGTGALWGMASGVVRGQEIERAGSGLAADWGFVQISDSHMGFSQPANSDVIATLQETVAKINALPSRPAFVLHTGDITHLSKPEEFDTADQILQAAKAGRIFFVPGEHDVMGESSYLERYGKETKGDGWYSFDHRGAHFVGLNNVKLRQAGLGRLGPEQLEWLEADLEGLSASTPVVVFAHMPLWTVYEKWGWGTADAMEAMTYLRRFGSVSVLNGHIHQTMQKVEGNIVFHTAASTAFPQPPPGAPQGPGPWTVPSDKLRSMLGLTSVSYRETTAALAIADMPLFP